MRIKSNGNHKPRGLSGHCLNRLCDTTSNFLYFRVPARRPFDKKLPPSARSLPSLLKVKFHFLDPYRATYDRRDELTRPYLHRLEHDILADTISRCCPPRTMIT